jgi:ribosomal-protein-alanine N-acetyltransferase
MSDKRGDKPAVSGQPAPARGGANARAAEFFRLGPGHVEAVVALERLCFSSPWTAEQFNLAFKQEVFHVFGLRTGGRLAAYVAFYHAADQMEILNLAVHPDLRRCGFAKRLLGLTLQIARKMGILTATLEVRQTNEAAQQLYKVFGFVQVGRRKEYYPDTREDALVLSLNL